MEDALKRVKEFEREEDERVAQSALTAIPIRGPLGMIHGFLDRYAFGDRIFIGPPDIGLLEAVAGRLFGAWEALKQCPRTEGEGYRAEMERYQAVDPTGSQVMELLGYGHFCELMPEIHQGLWRVSDSSTADFALAHNSEGLARAEILDFLLLQLVSPVLVGPFYLRPATATEVARRHPNPVEACNRLGAEGRTFRDDYIRLIESPPLLSDAGFAAATGVSRNKFRRLQAALFALSDLLVSLANAHFGFAFHPETEADEHRWTAMEHASVTWRWEALVDWLASVASVPSADVEELLRFFVLDLNEGDDRAVRDGYFPPLVRVEDFAIVSPAMLRLLVMERNILYVINATDRKHFDNVVSEYLEPKLLEDFAALFTRVPTLKVRTSIEFESGELDLLVFDEVNNVALHAQAKAALPPQGGRMTTRIEGRSHEALRQIDAFGSLPSSDRDRIIGNAVGETVVGVDVVNALLSRSCFGREPIWQRTGDVALLNVSLLALLLSRAIASERPIDLSTLPSEGVSLLNEMASVSGATWNVKTVTVGEVALEVPMLDYDRDAITSYRIRAVHAVAGEHDRAARPVVA